MNGSATIISIGVKMRHLRGAFARTAMLAASSAYIPYKIGAMPKEIRIFHVAKTSRAAILTTDPARASAAE